MAEDDDHIHELYLVDDRYSLVIYGQLTPLVCVHPLLDLVMKRTTKVLVTGWGISNLNRHIAMKMISSKVKQNVFGTYGV